MKYATAILVCLTYLVSAATVFWHGRTELVNWIYARPTPMPLEWNVKFLADEINALLIAVSIYTYKSNKVNRSAAIAYLFYCAMDVVVYFYNYKTAGYGAIYFFIPFVILLAYYWKDIKRFHNE